MNESRNRGRNRGRKGVRRIGRVGVDVGVKRGGRRRMVDTQFNLQLVYRNWGVAGMYYLNLLGLLDFVKLQNALTLQNDLYHVLGFIIIPQCECQIS